jgi:hypothetical protein
MKPRLKLYRGLWNCWDRNSKRIPVGVGYTPAQAYEDWLYMVREYGDAA